MKTLDYRSLLKGIVALGVGAAVSFALPVSADSKKHDKYDKKHDKYEHRDKGRHRGHDRGRGHDRDDRWDRNRNDRNDRWDRNRNDRDDRWDRNRNDNDWRWDRNRNDNDGRWGRDDNRSSNVYTGTVTRVRSSQNFDVVIGGQTYNVYTYSRLPYGLGNGDIVRVSGDRVGSNDIRNANVSLLRNR